MLCVSIFVFFVLFLYFSCYFCIFRAIFVGPEDPTCEKCSRNWERNTDVTRAFQNPKHVQARKAFYQNTFKAVPHNTVTVQAVNYGQVRQLTSFGTIYYSFPALDRPACPVWIMFH